MNSNSIMEKNVNSYYGPNNDDAFEVEIPNEVCEMFFDHLSPEQKKSISRVCQIFNLFGSILISNSDKQSIKVLRSGIRWHEQNAHSAKFSNQIIIFSKEPIRFSKDTQCLTFENCRFIGSIQDLAKRINESQIERLEFENCTIENSEDSLPAQCAQLLEKTQLESFAYTHGNITEADGEELAKALKNNTTLKTLLLGSNHINNKSITPIANSLMNNTSLELLNLQNNEIGDSGVKALVDMLKTTQIYTLWLDNNNIGDSAVNDFISLKGKNFHLLNLMCNKFTKKGNKDINNALQFDIECLLIEMPIKKLKEPEPFAVPDGCRFYTHGDKNNQNQSVSHQTDCNKRMQQNNVSLEPLVFRLKKLKPVINMYVKIEGEPGFIQITASRTVEDIEQKIIEQYIEIEKEQTPFTICIKVTNPSDNSDNYIDIKTLGSDLNNLTNDIELFVKPKQISQENSQDNTDAICNNLNRNLATNTTAKT